jgi:hypothetical protein
MTTPTPANDNNAPAHGADAPAAAPPWIAAPGKPNPAAPPWIAAPGNPNPAARRVTRLITNMTSAERKTYPLAEGVLKYFPDALAYVAHVSFKGNEKHNPGQPLHHSRGKSADHADCIMRHLQEVGTLDPEGVRHSGALAWRALALLQEELERDLKLDVPPNATALPPR